MAKIVEKNIQEFISKFPWLLNIDYRNVPELDKKRFEFLTKENKRIDLILKDYKTNCPVIVEFKLGDFTRETIGQILEYKARIFSHFNEEDELLNSVFGKNLFCPKLVLVVRTSDEYGRIACNLQNIELYEYRTLEEKIINDEIPDINRLEDFSKSLRESSLAITWDRNEHIQNKVYKVIEELFEKYNIKNKWHNYRNVNIGEWHDCYKNMFLNKWILQEEEISIAIYEELVEDKNFSVFITFYSWRKNQEELNKIKSKFLKLEKLLKSKNNLTQDIKPKIDQNDDESYDIYLFQKYENNKFYENVEKIIEFSLSNYLKVVEI